MEKEIQHFMEGHEGKQENIWTRINMQDETGNGVEKMDLDSDWRDGTVRRSW